MRCPVQTGDNAELLLAYCARKLDPDTRAALERHMRHCPECRALGEQQKAVWKALDEWEALPVSEDFDARLFERIERTRESRRLTGLRGRLRIPAPLAAASVLLAVVWLLRSPQPPSALEFEEVGAAEVESVETALQDIEMLRALELMARAEAVAPTRM